MDFLSGTTAPQWAMASSFTRFLDHIWCATVSRTPLDEWSARCRDLYLTTRNTHNRQISMPPSGIRTHDLSRRAAADLCLRLRGRWYWQKGALCNMKIRYVIDVNQFNNLVTCSA